MSLSNTNKPRYRYRRLLVALFVASALINYMWEVIQAPLYHEMKDFGLVWWHCSLAALGDGLLVLLIYAAGQAALRRHDWFVHPGRIGYALMLLTGLIVGIGIEWVAVFIGSQWSYTPRMPLIPVLHVGIAPVAQMLGLPPLIFRIVAVWYDRGSAK